MGKDFGVTFLGLWWAEFHAEKEMGAKMVGLPGSAVVDILLRIEIFYSYVHVQPKGRPDNTHGFAEVKN